MARSRNIKPGFFSNDTLGELEPLARLLFAGMWCHADRRGRLEDRPKRLKAEILPYDNCDVDRLLQCLHDASMVHRYVVDGKGYIQITNFEKHQNPHIKEQESTIPAPDMSDTRMEVATLIPDSLIPHTDSLIPIKEKPLASSDESLSAGKKKINGSDLSPVIEKIPIIGDQEHEVHQSSVQEWERLFPAVDVPQTLKEIRAWNLANPKNRKTATGVVRHITQWLAKEQNKPPPMFQNQRR